MRRRKLRKYAPGGDYGDIWTKPKNTSSLEAGAGAAGQAASAYYSSGNLNTIVSDPAGDAAADAAKQAHRAKLGSAIATAGQLVGSAIESKKPLEETDYTGKLQTSRAQAKAGVTAIGTGISAINPLVGGAVLAAGAIGNAVGSQTVDEFGQYKSRTGNFLDENLNMTTGYQGVVRALKGKQTASGVVNKLTHGLLGKSDNQKEAEKGKAQFERDRLRKIRERSQQTLADYPIYGRPDQPVYAKYGAKFPMGGDLPVPTDQGDGTQLASNMAQYHGPKHANGGIQLDTDQNADPDIEVEGQEVIKDNMVFSNRLRPSKQIKSVVKASGVGTKKGDTYATLSARIGKKKGRFEQNINSTRPGEKNSASIMQGRLDEVANSLFMDQQVRKFKKGKKGNGKKYPNGGVAPYSPEYLKINPLNSPEQAQIKAQANLQNALRFKNQLHGNVVPQVPVAPKMISNTSITNSYATADPLQVQRADSVINATKTLFLII